ncbi:MAG: 1-acyl-sn-glycerol-3-phosphate acyltransferase [Myxococcota bacterium]
METPIDRIDLVDATPDALSSMTPRFNWPFQWFARRFFRHFDLDARTVEHLRELESRGSVVYVMRYASRLDYFLFNTLFVREGLKLSRFANGIRFFYYRPLLQMLRLAWSRRSELFREFDPAETRSSLSSNVCSGASSFLFLRTARIRTQLRSRKSAVERGKGELDLLEEIVENVWDSDRPVYLVPLALFWTKGPRSHQGFLNLTYGATTRPSDLAKVISFLTTYRGLCVKVGDSIDLGRFVDDQRNEGRYRIARKVRRSILTFLYREEKVVEGPTLRPRHRVQQSVVGNPAVESAIRDWANERNASVERGHAEAAKMFREIAANMNSTFLAALNFLVGAILKRLFTSIELTGIEKIADYAKRQPLVLVPSHRSYFDFLILSSIFYGNHLVPPHIAARDNMAFGPFGFIWRRAGAFFLRRSFEDPLYKVVFRTYVSHLIKQGFPQEFFIEGGRSRTGKSLAPRLGMLSWNVDAFLASARRDMFFVPIAISYERLVEESAMMGELDGETKRAESIWGLVRARKFLRLRFGSVFVNFGEPISMADTLGEGRERFLEDTPEGNQEKRILVEGLGNRIVERINWAVIPNATSVAACALMGEPRRGMFREELAVRMQQVVDLLRLQDVRLTPALDRDEGGFRESIGSMLSADLIRSDRDMRGEVLYYERGRVRVLDMYRNTIVHYLATPSFLARHLLSSPKIDDVRAELPVWLDLFYFEFFTPKGEVLASHVDAFIDHFERFGWIERSGDRLDATEKGVSYFRFLAEQTRGIVEVYYATSNAVLAMRGSMSRKSLLKAADDHYGRSELLGEVARREAANETAFRGSLDLMERRGILEPDPDSAGKEPMYRPGPVFDDVVTLRRRLAAALAAR